MDIHEELKNYEGLEYKYHFIYEIKLSDHHDLTLQEKHDLYILACELIENKKLSLIEIYSKIFIAGKINGIRQERKRKNVY